MSNAMNNLQGPQGVPQGAPQYGQPAQNPNNPNNQQPSNNNPNKEYSFFRWVRESGVERTNNRVIAGVCGAIAQELGWNVTLVRVLMIVAAFLGGFGAILYGIAWAILPDADDHGILLEDLIHGHWNWSFIGVILCILVSGAIYFPAFTPLAWVNLTPLLLALLVMYLLIDHGRRRFLRPVNNAPNAAPNTVPNNIPPQGTQPVQQSASRPMPAAGAPTNAPYRQQANPRNATQQNMPSQHVPPQSAPSAMPSGAQAAAAQTANGYTYQYQYAGRNYDYHYECKPKKRRKPAGPILVLFVFGLILLGLGAVAATAGVFSSHFSMLQAAQSAVLYIGIVCLVLGAIIIVLGCMGRRTGGLHPFAWLFMFLAALAMVMGTAFAAANAIQPALSSHYTHINVDKTLVIDSSKSNINKLSKGVAITGQGYDKSTVTIDLTDYARNNGKHTVTLNDGSTTTTTCPVEDIPMTVTDARVVVKLPYGCSWIFQASPSLHDYADEINAHDSLLISSIPVGARADTFNVFTDENLHSAFDLQVGDAGLYVGGSVPPTAFYQAYGSKQMQQLCNGISENDGKVTVSKNANAQGKQLIEHGYYWPCAPYADKAADPELRIAPRVLRNASINVEYAGSIPGSKE